MKNFDGWFKKVLKVGDHNVLKKHKSEYAAAWVGALQWVNNMLWLASGQVADEVKERIKKELENN